MPKNCLTVTLTPEQHIVDRFRWWGLAVWEEGQDLLSSSRDTSKVTAAVGHPFWGRDTPKQTAAEANQQEADINRKKTTVHGATDRNCHA